MSVDGGGLLQPADGNDDLIMAAAPPPPVSTILGHTVFPPAFLPLTTTTFTAQTSIYPRTMPHADAANIPEHVRSKAELWELIYTRLEALLEGERNWVRTEFYLSKRGHSLTAVFRQVTNCANAASLVFTALLSSSEFFGTRDMAVNWCGTFDVASPTDHRLCAVLLRSSDMNTSNRILPR